MPVRPNMSTGSRRASLCSSSRCRLWSRRVCRIAFEHGHLEDERRSVMMKKKALVVAIGLVVICLIAGFTAGGSLAAKKTDVAVAQPSERSPLQAAVQA